MINPDTKMSRKLSSKDELEHYLEQIKALEKQIENIEAHRRIDLRGQNLRVDPPVRERHGMEFRSKNKPEDNAAGRQETSRKTIANENRINNVSRVNEVDRPPRRSMKLFEDVDLEEIDEDSNIYEEGNVDMSHPYGDLFDEEYSENAPYQPKVVRTKEILRRKEEASGGQVRNYAHGSQSFRQRSVKDKTNKSAKGNDPKNGEPIDRTGNRLDPTSRNRRCETPVVNQNNMRHDMTNGCKSYYVKPPKFDGKTCIESHLTQFRIAASRNEWNESERVDFLKMSLIGEANSILKNVSDNITYAELKAKLKQRYGSLDQVEAFRVQLKARRRKKNETLSELMMDIRRLFALAYPGPKSYMSDIAAKDSFIDALDDKELMIRVMEREPKNLEEAFKIAERMELYSKRIDNSDRTENETKAKNKVRAATAKDDSNIKMLMENHMAMQHQITSLIQLMQQQNKQSLQQSLETQKKKAVKFETVSKPSDRPVVNCFGCGKEGHFRSRCPEKNNGKFGFNTRRNYSEQQNPPTDKEENNESSSVRKIGQTLCVKMRIGEKTHNCLIDTGSEVNFIPSKYVEEEVVWPSSKMLEAANNTSIGMLGKMDIEVEVTKRKVVTKFVVSDQLEEIIMGMEWLQRNNCCILFPQNITMIDNVEVPLLKKVPKDNCYRIILHEYVEIPSSSTVEKKINTRKKKWYHETTCSDIFCADGTGKGVMPIGCT